MIAGSSPRSASKQALVLVILTLGILLLPWRQRTDPLRTDGKGQDQRRLCSAFDEPGRLEYDLADALATNWTATGSCPSPPNWVAKLARLISVDRASVEYALLRGELAFLANQTVLYIGDSTDRQALDDLSQLLYDGRPAAMTSHEAPEEYGISPGWSTHQSPRFIHVRQLDLRFVNVFHFGIHDTPWFRDRAGDRKAGPDGVCDCLGPTYFEDIVDDSLVPVAERLTIRPTLVVFQSMLWDIRYYHETGLANSNVLHPFDAVLVEHYRQRLVEATRYLLQRFPRSDVIFRGGYVSWSDRESYHSAIRDQQLIRAQRMAIIEDVGVPYMPIANVIGDGWKVYGSPDTHLAPVPKPGVIALIWPVLDYLRRRSLEVS